VGRAGNGRNRRASRGMGRALLGMANSYGRIVMDKKLAEAIAWMGTRWVLHPDNRIQKLKQPLPADRTMEPKVLKGVRK
jgi:hypothetical protein